MPPYPTCCCTTTAAVSPKRASVGPLPERFASRVAGGVTAVADQEEGECGEDDEEEDETDWDSDLFAKLFRGRRIRAGTGALAGGGVVAWFGLIEEVKQRAAVFLRLAVVGAIGRKEESGVGAAIEHGRGGVDIGESQGGIHRLCEKCGVTGNCHVGCFIQGVQHDGDVLFDMDICCVPGHFIAGIRIKRRAIYGGAEGVCFYARLIFAVAEGRVIGFGES